MRICIYTYTHKCIMRKRKRDMNGRGKRKKSTKGSHHSLGKSRTPIYVLQVYKSQLPLLPTLKSQQFLYNIVLKVNTRIHPQCKEILASLT